VKILLLSQFFDPEPGFKGLYLAKALRDRGHEVVVLTGYPNYPDGKLYAGYRIKPFAIETKEGVKIIRVALYPSHNRSSLMRAANYLSFMVSSVFGGLFLTGKPDIIYCYHPPATSGLAAALLSKAKGVPFVYDIQDLWPDSVATTGMVRSGFVLSLIRAVCEIVYRSASHIAVLSPGFRNELIRRGIPPAKVSVIYNWCDEASLAVRKSPRAEIVLKKMEGRFNITYAGNMGMAQSLDTVLEAAASLQRDYPRIQFNFIGGGIDKARLQKLAAARNLPNVVFFRRLDPSEIGPVLGSSDVLLAHLKHAPLFTITIPSKIQTYLYAGKPILSALEGDAADLLLKAKAGIVCAPENPDELAKCAVRFYRMSEEERLAMGTSGQRFYHTELNMAKAVEQFEKVFGEAVSRPAR
jgi:putative colanic acid biosynthesis glycosyltransferase WcaI